MGVGHIALVTDEWYPLTRGGIGRLAHLVVADALRQSPDVEIHLVACGTLSSRACTAEQTFGRRVKVHPVDFSDAPTGESGSFPPADAFTDTSWHWQSLQIMRALRRIEASVPSLQWIEFPDYRGWALCSMQEKLLGRAFGSTGIAVRLHSTDGLLQHFERRRPSPEQSGRFEIERKALLDADLVIAHVPSVADVNAAYYGFGPEWRSRVRVEFPPVSEDAASGAMLKLPADAARTSATPRDPDLMFATKVQAFKRPEVFVRGAALFLQQHPAYSGHAVLACHIEDDDLLARLHETIPPDVASRFAVVTSGAERDALLPQSVVVIPSAHESLCLTAFEASIAGARVVLNSRCAAFGDDSRWTDANCWKFDGAAEGLACALRAATTDPARGVVDIRSDAPYWLRPWSLPAAAPARARPRLGAVILATNSADDLASTLASLAAPHHHDLELAVVHDPSVPPSAVERGALGWHDRAAFRVVATPFGGGNDLIAVALGVAGQCDYLVALQAGDRVAPEFLEHAIAALERHPEFDVVAPTVGLFDTPPDTERHCSSFRVFLGDAPSLGLTANRLAPRSAVVRRSALAADGCDAHLGCGGEWSAFLRLAVAGRRFLVTNDVQVFSPRRDDAPTADVVPSAAHVREQHRVVEYVPLPLPASAHLAPLVAEVGAAVEEAARNRALLDDAREDARRAWDEATATAARLADEVAAIGVRLAAAEQAATDAQRAHADLQREFERREREKPIRYSVVDFINERAKKVPWVHPALKGAVSAVRREMRRRRGTTPREH